MIVLTCEDDDDDIVLTCDCSCFFAPDDDDDEEDEDETSGPPARNAVVKYELACAWLIAFPGLTRAECTADVVILA